MTIKTFCMTTVAAIALGGAVSAQTMIGDQEVNAGDLPGVTAHCEMLAAGGATTEVTPGNAGNPDTTGLEANPDATDLGAAGAEETVPGNTGNPDEAEDADTMATATTSGTDTAAPEANSGNVDAEEIAGAVNLQQITLAECQAAGL